MPPDHDASKPIATHVGGLVSLHCWLLGHPLPVIFNGPATVILYVQNLDFTRDTHGEHLVAQVVAFDATKPFNVLPTETDGGFWSEFVNGLTLESRLNVENASLLVEQVIPERDSSFGLYRRLFGHIVLAAVIAFAILLLSVRGRWG